MAASRGQSSPVLHRRQKSRTFPWRPTVKYFDSAASSGMLGHLGGGTPQSVQSRQAFRAVSPLFSAPKPILDLYKVVSIPIGCILLSASTTMWYNKSCLIYIFCIQLGLFLTHPGGANCFQNYFFLFFKNKAFDIYFHYRLVIPNN